ncbi:MAG: hypothetical protein WC315_00490 [Candidatus Omnitrophota bacterium]|jgi:hypothetical protein
MTEHINKWQVSNEKMTVLVQTRNGIITNAAPVVQIFIGQPLDNLAVWMSKMGSTTITPLEGHIC